MPPIAKTLSLDHLVLTVKDLDATVKFYEDVLGMRHDTIPLDGETMHTLHFGQQKINIHLSGNEFLPKAHVARPGTSDICFLVEDNIETVAQRLHEAKIEVLYDGKVVDQLGAHSKLRSVFFRDPDGNLIELANPIAL
ncbi:hypothetical protein ACHAPJ_010794 [Fusarium lateritium]